jgi:hypothetical protein
MKCVFFLSFYFWVGSGFAQSNVLTLTWLQPAGFHSTLYSSTNLNGEWTSLGEVNPPAYVTPTNPVTFFYVSVAPSNLFNEPIIYSTDPNAENLKPEFTNRPAMAYSEDGSGGIYGWSPSDGCWH